MEEDFETIDLKEFFTTIKNNMLLILVVTISFGIIGGVYTKFIIPEKFQAHATMIVNTRQDQNAVVTYDQINSAKQLVATYAVILKSDTVLDNVINNLNLRQIPGWEDLSIENLAKDVVIVEQVDTTQVIKISAKTRNADLSADIVSEIVALAPNMIINTVKAGSVEIISPPKANYIKVSPSTTKNTLFAAIIGAIISVGGVLLISILDNTFKSDADITKHLGLTVLGVIPSIKLEGGK